MGDSLYRFKANLLNTLAERTMTSALKTKQMSLCCIKQSVVQMHAHSTSLSHDIISQHNAKASKKETMHTKSIPFWSFQGVLVVLLAQEAVSEIDGFFLMDWSRRSSTSSSSAAGEH